MAAAAGHGRGRLVSGCGWRGSDGTAREQEQRGSGAHDEHGEVIHDGIALWFRAPASYTGEDVVELQGHGSPAVLREVLSRCLALGARIARPGEFSAQEGRGVRFGEKARLEVEAG